MKTERIQHLLNSIGIDAGPADGIAGPRTTNAIRQFQKRYGYAQTGKLTPQQEEELENGLKQPVAEVTVRNKIESPGKPVGSRNWPHQRDVSSFFGAPGNPRCTAGVVRLVEPMRLAWDKSSLVHSFRCHELVATPLTTIFAESVAHYGIGRWSELGLDLFGGCFNVRPMRGGTNYSMHSWGIAVDIDPQRNQLRWNKSRAVLAKDSYVPFWNIVESTGAVSLGRARDFDWMHFQFARIG